MDNLKFPEGEINLPRGGRRLSMDEYYEFVLRNLEGFDWERYRTEKTKQVISVRFSLDPEQMKQDRVAES